jgi:FkbM family methyltransferase
MINYSREIIDKTIIKPKNVLEIGSRDGHDAKILKDKFYLPENKIWVVEPNPKQVEYIKTVHNGFNVIPMAIFNEETEHDFYQVNGGEMEIGTSSLINRNDNWYDSKSTIIKVKTITGKQLLNIIDEEIDLCKLDVEGLTYEVLESFGSDLNKIKSFHLECEHIEIWKEQKLYPYISEFLNKNNYKQIFFTYCSDHQIQSDSIWVLSNLIK